MSTALTQAGLLGDTGLWVDVRGTGTPVLLLAGLGDPVEAWEFQLDAFAREHTVIALDNRGVGRSVLPDGELTVASMADDAALVLDTLGVGPAHVVGFSGGSAIAQELALRHPAKVTSAVLVGTWARADAHLTAMVSTWRWLAPAAPDPRTFLESFFVWVYTAEAHENGFVAAMVDAALEFPHPQSGEAFIGQLDAFTAHDTLDRLGSLTAPTLVVAGSEDMICPPRLGRRTAAAIPGAEYVELEGAGHQPFQEAPDEFNALLARFWSRIGN